MNRKYKKSIAESAETADFLFCDICAFCERLFQRFLREITSSGGG